MPSTEGNRLSGPRPLHPAPKGMLYWLTIVIAATTIAAGVVQIAAPGFVLDLLDASSTPSTRHFFAIVGMFMGVIGGALLHALLMPGDHRVLLTWAAVQKFGAFVAVSVGVINDIFSGLGIAVALNDLLSAGVILWYLRSLAAWPAPSSDATSEAIVR